MKKEEKLEVYNEKVEDIFKRLETNINGLSEKEATKRLERDGENKLEERKKKSKPKKTENTKVPYKNK